MTKTQEEIIKELKQELKEYKERHYTLSNLNSQYFKENRKLKKVILNLNKVVNDLMENITEEL